MLYNYKISTVYKNRLVWEPCVGQQKLCFIAFLIVLLTESFNNGQKLSEKTHLFLKPKEVKYPVGLLIFLKRWFFDRLIITVITLPPTSVLLAMSNSKFSANLIIKLVLLPTLASLAMSNGKFYANWVKVVLSIEMNDLANLLKPYIKCQ